MLLKGTYYDSVSEPKQDNQKAKYKIKTHIQHRQYLGIFPCQKNGSCMPNARFVQELNQKSVKTLRFLNNWLLEECKKQNCQNNGNVDQWDVGVSNGTGWSIFC